MSLPYGDDQQCQGYEDSPIHFTGKQRDAETNLDVFQARYYASMSGRWMLPDWSALPEAVPYANLGNPQTLNLYTYVGNNPITHTDVDGHYMNTANEPGGSGFTDGSGPGYYLDFLSGTPTVGEAQDFLNGLGNAFNSDLSLGFIPLDTPNSSAGELGAALGNAAAALQGAAEIVTGAAVDGGGAGACATGVGCVADAPVIVVGTAVGAHGVGAAAQGITHLMKSASGEVGVSSSGQKTDKYGNKLGGSGKPQQHETNSNTREKANNKALNEGSRSVNHSNPKSGQPHVHAADAEENKKPNSTHHNYPD